MDLLHSGISKRNLNFFYIKQPPALLGAFKLIYDHFEDLVYLYPSSSSLSVRSSMVFFAAVSS